MRRRRRTYKKTMSISLSDIHRKGFCLLHGKWGDSNDYQSMIGLNPVENGDFSIGYLAYPNSGDLKNEIPDRQFFNFNHLVVQNKIPKFDLNYETSGKLEQSVNKAQYLEKIHEIKELLAAGEVYQINYAIRFRKKFSGDPYALFQKLNEVNSVDFQAYINAGDFQMVSSSPERFFKVKNGKIVTQPIKGTAAKGRKQEVGNRKQDPNLHELLSSKKERAELDMITDLERNDVGKICEYGTLKLKKEREVLELPNLWHCYSEVEGVLRSDVDSEAVIKAMFPGGSITGCPKIRAMEYIAKLEGLPRNIYTGSIGFISDRRSTPITRGEGTIEDPIDNSLANGSSMDPQWTLNWSMDFNIAIRTILIKDGYLEFWAGGGIVADSDPESEYRECMLKAEKFLGLI